MSETVTEEPRGTLTIRTVAMPADANPAGDIFGGWVLSQMDVAGGTAAGEIAEGRVVTASIETMSFIRPVKVGDILCVYSDLIRIGNTSLQIHVEAWARRYRTGSREKVTDAAFTFVALDAAGKPRPVKSPGA